MDKHLEVIEKLDKINQKYFRPDELNKLGISPDEIEALVRQGLLSVDKSNPYPEWIYYIPASTYGLIQGKNNHVEEINQAKESTNLQWWGIIASIVLSVIALLISVFKP